MPVIRTPDQRLRVFVSSTMQELAPERTAAQKAIQNLHLSPILFELGARPHPPRRLYQAYLDQSHIFLGIYWQRYGWTAPGMDVSGLEDEYLLSTSKPRLIYVKRPAPEMEDRLKDLLDRIRDSDVSYKAFETAEELEELVENDLALLLTESFDVGRRQESKEQRQGRSFMVPARLDRFIGRERALEELHAIVTGSDERLITVTGPGGIGKTRLALELASRCGDDFADGLHFIALGSVSDPVLVVPTIVQQLNVQSTFADPLEGLIEHLRQKEMLLVLDNFEQVVTAAPDIARMIEQCPQVTALITSRSILNLRGEHEFAVSTLGHAEAVQLFVDRAQAIKHDFELTEDNAERVEQIAIRLDGLPLALELAAARIRLLTPDAMLARLDASLALLTGGSRDLPERHQTLRAAIDWSVGLLNDQERRLFVRLGVFRGGFTLEAAEAVCNCKGDLDLLDVMTSLLEKSLITHEARGTEARFGMLQTVWEYATELLKADPEVDEIREEHASFFLELVGAADHGLRSPEQIEWMARLESDHGNLRAAIRWYLDRGLAEKVANAGWTLWLFWWLNSHLAEGRQIATEVLESTELSPLALAKAKAVAGVLAFWQTDYATGVPLLGEAVVEMRENDFSHGVALCQLPLGFVEASLGDPAEARERLEESIAFFRASDDLWGLTLALNSLGWTAIALDIDPGIAPFEEAVASARKLGTHLERGMALRNLGGYLFRRGKNEEAKRLLTEAIELLWRGFSRGGTTYSIDAIAEIAISEGAYALGTRLLGATSSMREATAAPIVPMFAPRFERYLAMTRTALGDEDFKRNWNVGRGMGMDAACEEALAWARKGSVVTT